MNFNHWVFLIIYSCIALVSCKDESSVVGENVFIKSQISDSVILIETAAEEDIIVNDYLKDELEPIRENFKRLNSIEYKDWSRVAVKDLSESTEGGTVTFYNWNGVLDKIVTKVYGETYQQLYEYYLLNGKLSFVFEKLYKYNRPIYYDSVTKDENNDTQEFDFMNSEIIETRNYFINGVLVHQLYNQDCGSPFSKDYLAEEEIRIEADFKNLLKTNKY